MPLRARTITTRPELVSDPDEVQCLLALMAAPIRLSTVSGASRPHQIGRRDPDKLARAIRHASASSVGTPSPTASRRDAHRRAFPGLVVGDARPAGCRNRAPRMPPQLPADAGRFLRANRRYASVPMTIMTLVR